MSSKFIRTEEGPCTGFPCAFIGPFIWGMTRERRNLDEQASR